MSVTWLHISDLHIRAGDPYDRDVVLKALVRSARTLPEKGRKPDLIFVTGDIAYSGKAEEYEPATTFFDALLQAVGLDKSRLYVVPGNHDVDRRLGIGLARTLQSREEADSYFAPSLPKPHLTQKQGAFLRWYNDYFRGIRSMPDDSTCGPVELADIRGFKMGILPINSALFAQDGDDHGKLWIGRRCLDPALQTLKDLDADVNVALSHHPLDWPHSAERTNIKAKLGSHVDFILCGHLHEPEVESIASVAGQTFHMAAGAAYQSRRWPNRAAYVTIDGESATVFPIRYEDQPQEVWTVDPSVFPHDHDNDYQRSFLLPRREAATPEPPAPPARRPPESGPVPRFRSNIPSRLSLPFVGRDDLLQAISKTLGESSGERVLVLHGLSGTGKSELAREFGRRQQDRYPGGTFFIDAGQGAPFVDLARVGKNILNLDFPPDMPLQDQCLRTLHTLGMQPALLIYDNVLSPETISAWLPPAGMLCHVLITTVVGSWPPGWDCLEVPPLCHSASLQLILELAGREVTDRFGEQLAALAKGLPIQICPAATSLAYDERRGRLDSARLTMSSEAKESFRGVYDRLERSTRLVMHGAAFLNGDRILREELLGPLKEATGWSEAELQRQVDACLDLHLLQGIDELRMHQPLAAFVLDTSLGEEDDAILTKVRTAQSRRLVQLAKEVKSDPGDPESASRFMVFPLHPDAWMLAGIDISLADGEAVGRALYEIGRFDEALPWFKSAVVAKEKGEEDGPVEPESLGRSLHEAGYCISMTGGFEDALPWYERAVKAKEKGNVRGRVDRESLGRSLHEVGYCISMTGRFEDALLWYRRAVAAKEKGDVHGHVDHASLGRSLHQVGSCLDDQGKFKDALPWYKRAVEAKEKGDVHGRVDHASLARSLHEVGWCLSRMGWFEGALPWYERAVAAAEKGDVHGRVDHTSFGRGLHQVGVCLSRMGRFDEALPWYERAVEAKEKGDVHGRVDDESLGGSLHGVGYCFSRMGRFDEALPWYERAVEAAEKGDVHDRVDHESLGRSLHEVGVCLSRMGRFDEALPRYERAVEAKEKGDVHGRVDDESLGGSLHEVGVCLSRMGRFDEALPWYERAVEAAEKGDVHGRVDRESLALSLRGGAECLRKLDRLEDAKKWEEGAAKLAR